MNPSTATATVLVDELVRCGITDAVLCPGSRSAPLAHALHDADAAGRLRLHVRTDERGAGFLALGLALGSGRPVPVVTTSGSAVANLHPAVLEAHHSGVPVVVLSADRPAELVGVGANQATRQQGIFGPSVRHEVHLPADLRAEPGACGSVEVWAAAARFWRTSIDRALAAATGATGGDPGPVHVNVALREPLTHEPLPSDDALARALAGRPTGDPWTRVPRVTAAPTGVALAPGERTLVVLGSGPSPDQSAAVVAWATARRWPVIAEPFGRFDRSAVMPHGPLALTVPAWLDRHAPDRVLVVGRPTLSRPVSALLRRPGLAVTVLATSADWADPASAAAEVLPLDATIGAAPSERQVPAASGWASAWRHAAGELAASVAAVQMPWGSGLALARTLGESLPEGAQLFVGASNAARDLDLGLPPGAGSTWTIRAGRGLAGIDGSLATAMGLALAGGAPTYAWLGDLTFLHDVGSLAIGPREPRPDLTVLVGNDDGGGIFGLLEHGSGSDAARFERLFGTPTGADLGALCRGFGVRHVLAASADQARAELSRAPRGLTVVEVALDRAGHRGRHAALREAARAVLAG